MRYCARDGQESVTEQLNIAAVSRLASEGGGGYLVDVRERERAAAKKIPRGLCNWTSHQLYHL